MKTYEYRILNRRIPLPAERLYSYFYYMDLDVEAMRQAAVFLLGEHDFKSFCSSRSQAEDTVRRIYSLELLQSGRAGEELTVRISGNGFLYNMVRIIVGTLLRVGTGMYPPAHMQEIVDGRNRELAGPKVPGTGLTLVSIEEVGVPGVIDEENTFWSYELVQREIAACGRAELTIRACGETDFAPLLLRLTKQATRNGAAEVRVWDQTGFLTDGLELGYFRYRLTGEGYFVTSDPRNCGKEV